MSLDIEYKFDKHIENICQKAKEIKYTRKSDKLYEVT